jgi:hypothetical protein
MFNRIYDIWVVIIIFIVLSVYNLVYGIYLLKNRRVSPKAAMENQRLLWICQGIAFFRRKAIPKVLTSEEMHNAGYLHIGVAAFAILSMVFIVVKFT